MEAQEISMTPEIAKSLMERSKKNRRIEPRRVQQYANDMRNGRWKLNPADTIVVYKNGEPGNGHHRMLAVIQSGITIPVIIVTGCDESAFDVIDQGRKRTPSDVFSIRGISDSSAKSSCISRYFGIRREKSFSLLSDKTFVSVTRDAKISPSIMLDFYDKHMFIVDTVIKSSRRQYEKFKHLKQSFIGGMTLFLSLDKLHNVEYVVDFFDQVTSGQNVKNSTIYAFRDFLINESLRDGTSSSAYRTALFHRTWNNYVKGHNVTKFTKIDVNNIPELL